MDDLSKYTDEDIITIVSDDAKAELLKRGYAYGWYKKEPFVGSIYILVNPAFPDLVKIGYADDIQKRIKTLNRNSGLPDPFHCYAIYKVKKRLEDLRLHGLIDTLDPALRHSSNREFYEMDCQKAYDIMSAIAQINGEEENLVVNPLSDSYFDAVKPDKNAVQDTTNAQPVKKKTKLTFDMIHIPIGSTLVFIKDNTIICRTADLTNHVKYKDKIYSISGLAKELTGKLAIQGGRCFMYNGEILTDIRERLRV